MAKKYYAWSNFPKTGDREHIAPGDVVSAELLGVDDNEWNELVESKVVRTAEYPDVKDNESPREHQLRKIKELQDGFDPDEVEDNDEVVDEQENTDTDTDKSGFSFGRK